ncbi:helix-turn-helix transcriptional regulator [Streptococcus suis]|nr:helix-turn-helix transcriptional regulator [Streptococcus suis]
MTLPYRLKELRKQRNLTQKQVATSLSITQQSYARWENGKVMPNPDKLSDLAKFYGVTTDYLLEGKKDDVDSSTVDAIFRMASDGLTEDEKSLFRKDIIDYINERKKLFEEDR